MTPAEQIRKLLEDAYYYAKESHENCYDDPSADKPTKHSAARSYMAACVSKYSAAESIYWAHPELEDASFLDIIKQFKRVSNEAAIVFDGSRNLTGFHIELTYLEELLNGR